MKPIRLTVVEVNADIYYPQIIKVIGIGDTGNKITSLLNIDKRIEVFNIDRFNFKERLKNKLKNTDLLFIATGLEEKYIEEIVLFIAHLAKEMDIFTIIAISFQISSKEDLVFGIIYQQVKKLLPFSDSCIVITNQSFTANSIKPNEVKEKNYQILVKTIEDIIRVIIEPIIICIDFFDIKIALQNGGLSLVGIGSASGENRITDAINQAIKSISLQSKNQFKASKLLVIFRVDENITLTELDTAMQKIENDFPTDTIVVFSALFLLPKLVILKLLLLQQVLKFEDTF